jgi:hypothetical protein
MLWRDGHSDAERVTRGIGWTIVVVSGTSGSGGRADDGRKSGIFGDNKSRFVFLQTAEFAAIFDPH